MAKPEKRRREQVFLVTVAVDAERYVSDSSRALATLKLAGYTARPMTREVLALAAEDPEGIPQFREIGPQHDPEPPSAA